MTRWLLYGGSFDPVHNGHVHVARAAADHLRAARTFLIPAATPPHKQRELLASAADRLAMCRLAVQLLPSAEVSDWELSQNGPNYTLFTVRHFQSLAPTGAELCWLVGMDSLNDIGSWHRVRELADECTLVTAPRPGQPVPDRAALLRVFSPAQAERIEQYVMPLAPINVSATEVRRRVRAGESIADLVPPSVAEYVATHALYRENGGSGR